MKKRSFKNGLRIKTIIAGIFFVFLTCDNNESYEQIENTIEVEEISNFKTANVLESLEFFETIRKNLNKSGKKAVSRDSEEDYITAIADEFYIDDITNSDEWLTVMPVTTVYNHLDSRILRLEVNDEQRNVVFSTNAFENSTPASFSGEILITDLDGNFIKGYRVENNAFVVQYEEIGESGRYGAQNTTSRDELCTDCPYDDCDFCGMLGEVTVTVSSPTPYVSITTIYNEGSGAQEDYCEAECNGWGYGGGGAGSSSGDSNSDGDDEEENDEENSCVATLSTQLDALLISLDNPVFTAEVASFLGENNYSCEAYQTAIMMAESLINTSSDYADYELPPSCLSFNFVNVMSNLQMAAVKNIRFRCAVLTPQGTYIRYNVHYTQPILFGMPRNMVVGGDISNGLAANLSAFALHVAIGETQNFYGDQFATELQVRLYFEQRLKHNYAIGTNGGRANFNPATMMVEPTEYITNALTVGDDCPE